MKTTHTVANPFALMMDPAAVIAAMERSERLSRLNSRVCRPLDKPLAGAADAPTADDDHSVDASPEAGEN